MLRADGSKLGADGALAKKALLDSFGKADAGGIMKLFRDIESAEKALSKRMAGGDLIGAGKMAANIATAKKRLDELTGEKPGGGDDYMASGGGILSPRATAPVRLAAKALTDPLGALEAVMSKLGPEGELAAIAMETVGTVYGKMILLAGAASPQSMERYNEAFQDLNAVMGRLFVPVLTMSTEVVRDFADFMNTILPSAEDVRLAFEGFRPVLLELRMALADIAPEIKMTLIIGLKYAAQLMQDFGEKLAVVVKIASWFVKLSSPISLTDEQRKLLTGGTLASSVGMGQQATARYTSAADLERSAQIAAFSVFGEKSQQELMVAEQQRTNALLEQQNNALGTPATERAVQGFAGGAN